MQTPTIDGKSFMRLCEQRLDPKEVIVKEKAKISNTSDISELFDYANAYCRSNNPGSEYAVDMMRVVKSRSKELRDKLMTIGENSLYSSTNAIQKLDEILALA